MNRHCRLIKVTPRCHSIKNTFLAVWPAEHPRWTLPQRSFSPQAAENLLTSAFGCATSSSTILSACPLLNLSCWSKTVKDSVVFPIIPHDRKFLSVSIHPRLSLKSDLAQGWMKTSGLFSERVSGCLAAAFSLMWHSGPLSSWHIWPHSHPCWRLYFLEIKPFGAQCWQHIVVISARRGG